MCEFAPGMVQNGGFSDVGVYVTSLFSSGTKKKNS